MRNLFVLVTLLFLLFCLFISCEKETNSTTKSFNKNHNSQIEFQEIEIENIWVWDFLVAEKVLVINSKTDLNEIINNCSFEFDDTIFEIKTLLFFKGTAYSNTAISELSYNIYSNDSNNFVLQVNIVGSTAQLCDSKTVRFIAIIDKVDDAVVFEKKYVNFDCFKYYE